MKRCVDCGADAAAPEGEEPRCALCECWRYDLYRERPGLALQEAAPEEEYASFAARFSRIATAKLSN